jgi:hypothetical protein
MEVLVELRRLLPVVAEVWERLVEVAMPYMAWVVQEETDFLMLLAELHIPLEAEVVVDLT